MAITILPATPSDSAVLTPIGLLAFANDPLNQALVTTTTPTPAQQEEYVQYRIQRNERRMAGPGKSWFKAVDSDTGEVLGYTGILAPEQVKVLGGVVAGSGPANADGPLPEILNREWVDVVEREFGALKKRHLDGREDFWYVPSMVVHPKHQGRGIGRKLLDASCELVDKTGQDIYLEASPSGRRLYEKSGFQVLEEVNMLNGTQMTAMLRRARSA